MLLSSNSFDKTQIYLRTVSKFLLEYRIPKIMVNLDNTSNYAEALLIYV